MDFVYLNRRLQAVRLLSDPRDQQHFADLLETVRNDAKRLHLESIEHRIPDVEESNAWTKAFMLFQEMQRISQHQREKA